MRRHELLQTNTKRHNEKYTIKRGDRIAQGVVCYVLKTKWAALKKVNKLTPTTRGSGGFGSTGKK